MLPNQRNKIILICLQIRGTVEAFTSLMSSITSAVKYKSHTICFLNQINFTCCLWLVMQYFSPLIQQNQMASWIVNSSFDWPFLSFFFKKRKKHLLLPPIKSLPLGYVSCTNQIATLGYVPQTNHIKAFGYHASITAFRYCFLENDCIVV